MRGCFWGLVLCLWWVMPGAVQAQSVVRYSLGCEPNACPEAYLSRLRAVLAAHAVDLVIHPVGVDAMPVVDIHAVVRVNFLETGERLFGFYPNPPGQPLPLSASLQKHPGDPLRWEAYTPEVIRMLAAILLYELGQCDAALSDFWVLAALFEQTGQTALLYGAQFYLANCYILRGEEAQAEALLMSLYAARPHGAAYNLAWLKLRRGEAQPAFQILNREVAYWRYNRLWRYEKLIEALSYRARLHALAFAYDDALRDIEEALRCKPAVPDDGLRAALLTVRGEIYLLLYEWQNALADFDAAVALDAGAARAYFYRGVTWYTLVNRPAALADFEQYLRLAPQGIHASAARKSADSIRAELQALGGG